MSELRDLSIKVSNYKCFGEEKSGFDAILPINIIIGKNNSGKTSLVEVIDHLVTNGVSNSLNKNGVQSRIYFKKKLLRSDIELGFKSNLSGGAGFPSNISHLEFGLQEYEGEYIEWKMTSINFNFESVSKPHTANLSANFNEIVRRLENPLKFYKLITLNPKRGIEPEVEKEDVPIVTPTGANATSLIHQFLTRKSRDRDLIEKTILDELNKIFNPDSLFTRIIVEKNDISSEKNNKWEIALEEKTKGRIPLSESGSGIETVLLVLIFLHLIPVIDNKKVDSYIFVFEELENNLHPSLQKKLFSHLREIALTNRAKFIITTHSPVVIDLFSNDENAQILHVTHDGTEAQVRPLTDFHSKSSAIDDIGIKPSDLLQSNSIIWVEGPSDRIYLNKWISLLTNSEIKENYHYQFAYYGGKLLSHYSASDPDNPEAVEDFISILKLNARAIIVADSDKKSEDDDIRDTKKRIQEELEKTDGHFWLTNGREIENYLPLSVISTQFPSVSKEEKFERFEKIGDLLGRSSEALKKKYEGEKVKFAKLFSEQFTEENLQENKELKSEVQKVVNKIKYFNELR